ncbi:MAG: hypothetical protein NVV59_07255 [Chitinophagaceae bacterium]|nr:hypothetical protein [Chitinophagaceae bacterium]
MQRIYNLRARPHRMLQENGPELLFMKMDSRFLFNLKLKKGKRSDWELYFINAEERFQSGNLIKKGDSLLAKLDPFDNEMIFHVQGDSLAGQVRRQDGKGTALKLRAAKGRSNRFAFPVADYLGDINGTYEVTFFLKSGGSDPSVAIFKQEGQRLTASFLRITGDSRFLEGVIINDSFFLSSYIGYSPSFYRGRIEKDGKISGETVGARGPGQRFEGVLNDEASLPDAFELTTLREGYSRFDFSFPDMKGKKSFTLRCTLPK